MDFIITALQKENLNMTTVVRRRNILHFEMYFSAKRPVSVSLVLSSTWRTAVLTVLTEVALNNVVFCYVAPVDLV